MARVVYTPSNTVNTDGIHECLPRLDAAIEAAKERPDDLAVLQRLRDAATEVLKSPTVRDVNMWVAGFKATAKIRPNLGL